MGIDNVDELVDIINKNLEELYVTFAKTAKHESRPVKFKTLGTEKTLALKAWLTARLSMSLPALLAGFTVDIQKDWLDH